MKMNMYVHEQIGERELLKKCAFEIKSHIFTSWSYNEIEHNITETVILKHNFRMCTRLINCDFVNMPITWY